MVFETARCDKSSILIFTTLIDQVWSEYQSSKCEAGKFSFLTIAVSMIRWKNLWTLGLGFAQFSWYESRRRCIWTTTIDKGQEKSHFCKAADEKL